MAATRKSSTYVDPVTGKTPAQLRAEQDAVLRTRRIGELDAAVNTAETAEDLARATQERDDFYTDERIANAERAAEAAGANAEKSVNDLVAQFNRGSITAEKFKTDLRAIIGGDMGDELGAAFSVGFNEAFQAALAQANLLAQAAYRAVTGTGGGETTNPAALIPGEEKALKAWKQRRANFIEALGEAKPGGKWKDKATRDAFLKRWKAADLKEWERENKAPKVSQLAEGGILRRAVLAGEAGREAVIPLDANAGRVALARAMSDAGAGGGRGPVTINLTFEGVLDAREAARRIQPELQRIVSLI
jgi:hypothetical protein